MKIFINTFLILCLLLPLHFSSCSGGGKTVSSDSTGLPGDNLSLAAVLEVFKNSRNPEDFEKQLNSSLKQVNNLDLNGDHKADYLRVRDLVKKNAHVIVIQDLVGVDEVQDVAIISMMKHDNQKTSMQIVGNEYIYGKNYILEPSSDGRTESADLTPFRYTATAVFVDVSLWPAVGYIYSPVYQVYESPVVWGIYPLWYIPYTPMPWGWYNREIVVHAPQVILAETVIMTPGYRWYIPAVRNSVVVYNRYNAIYVKRGYPKFRGTSMFGPGAKPFPKHFESKGPHFKDRPAGHMNKMSPGNGAHHESKMNSRGRNTVGPMKPEGIRGSERKSYPSGRGGKGAAPVQGPIKMQGSGHGSMQKSGGHGNGKK